MKYLLTVKRLAVAAVAAAALAGPVTAAHALQFSQGDAVLAVYGNGTEYVANIGTISNVLTNGVDVDLSSFLSTVGAGGNTIKYTVAGYSGTAITFGDNSPIGDWTTLNKNQVVPNTLIGGLQNWSGPLAVAGDARVLFPNVDPLSFSSNLNASGADTLGGTVPSARPGMATIDTVLNLLQRTGGPTTLAQVGTGLLSSQTGHFVVSVNAVPVPAAVVLFATGIIGLVGLARRRMSGAHPDAA
ncbi:MAG TPA: hypothetical protein VN638_07905 [Nitrospiraceae bacterium]|jgi:hypothetical protein|nr:hypothetical protein [Nitrospiraceae bacterium]